MMSTGTLGFLLLFFFVLVASTGANSTTITTEELLDEIFGSPGDSSIFAEEEEEEEEDHCSTDADCSGGRGRCQRPVRPWMPRTCACEEPYSGRNCQTCESCVSDTDCRELLHCVQCSSFNFFWEADGDALADEESILDDCEEHCDRFEYRVVGDMSDFGGRHQVCSRSLLGGSCEVKAAPPRDGVIAHTRISCTDTEEKELDDGHYEGMMLDCGSGETVPDGMGRLRYHQADIFGRRIYSGMFSCGARHGRGLQEWRDGSAYSGDFDGGVRRGQGRMRYPAGGASYVGSWENDTRHGRGVYYGKDQVYVGDFAGGIRHGEGEVYLAAHQDDPIFVGTFRNGRRVRGEARVPHARGSPLGGTYTGEFQDGKFHGYGKYEDSCGNVYEGDWVSGRREGRGNFSWADGQSYEGQWVGGRREGEGFFAWNNGERYDGEFRADRPHGRGTLYWMDESTFTGVFDQGRMTEEGRHSGPPHDLRENRQRGR